MDTVGSYEQIIYNAALQKLQAGGMANAKVLANLMVAQAKHETNGFKSPVFIHNKNAFGYKRYPGSVYQAGNGRMSPEGNNYAQYNSVADSAREVAAWILRRKQKFADVNTKALYSQRLYQAGYYGLMPKMTPQQSIDNYTAGLSRFYKEITPMFGTGILLAVLGVGCLLYSTI